MSAGLLLILRPLQDTPFIDDWTYAWSVENLLRHGTVRLLDWSSNLNVVQVLWGALFCLPGGFSFTALRASTWVLAVSSLCAFHSMLLELGVPRYRALLAAATLAFNPVFFVLAHTFMTDVPFLSAMLWASLAMVRALNRRDTRWLVAASVLASVSIGIRAVGLAVPLAMFLVLLLHAGDWGRQPRRLFWSVLPLLSALVLIWWATGHAESHADLSEIPDAPVNRIGALRYALPFLHQMVLFNFNFVTGVVGLALLPLSLASAQWRRRLVLAFVILVIIEALVHMLDRTYAPLLDRQTWALTELGLTEPLIPNFEARPLPAWCLVAAPLAAIISFSVFLDLVVARWRSPAEAFLAWLTISHFVVMALLWLLWDRYALVLLPGSIALVVSRAERWRPGVALLGVACLALISCVGLRDHLRLNGSLWRAVAMLRDRGVPPAEIDGGYVVNGWLQYAHPEDAPRDSQGEIFIQGLTTRTGELPYQISTRSLPGWKVLDSIAYQRRLAPSGRIWILERPGSKAPQGEAVAGESPKADGKALPGARLRSQRHE